MEFANVFLTSGVPAAVQPAICGAWLCALNRKNGGCTLRRLAAKAACKAVTKLQHDFYRFRSVSGCHARQKLRRTLLQFSYQACNLVKHF
jgi:hypothetical protein